MKKLLTQKWFWYVLSTVKFVALPLTLLVAVPAILAVRLFLRVRFGKGILPSIKASKDMGVRAAWVNGAVGLPTKPWEYCKMQQEDPEKFNRVLSDAISLHMQLAMPTMRPS